MDQNDRTVKSVKLIAALNSMGWNNTEVAAEIGLEKTAISRVLRGQQNLSEASARLLDQLALRERVAELKLKSGGRRKR